VIASIHERFEYGHLVLPHPESDNPYLRNPEYSIAIQWMPCHYGGKRSLFICPVPGCGPRVAILYAGSFFACRQCYRLAYPNQRRSASSRAIKRAQAIRMKLGGSGNLQEPFPLKPKGMHLATYERLESEALRHLNEPWSSLDYFLPQGAET